MSEVKIEVGGQGLYAPDWEAAAKLSAKIAQLMASVGSVGKDQRMKGTYSYDYVSYEQMAAVTREALNRAGLAFVASVDGAETESFVTAKGVPMVSTRVALTMTLVDTETGAFRTFRWAGEGQDSQDKGLAKAVTSGVKYFWLRSLLTSEKENVDPDAHDVEKEEGGKGDREELKKSSWFAREDARNAFWNYCGKAGLSQNDVRAALGVDVSEYEGSMADAKAALGAYIDRHAADKDIPF